VKVLEHRLAPDMKGLAYQVQSCSNTCKFLATRVAGMEVEVFPDDETTFEQLGERIDKTIKVLEAIDPKKMDGMEDKDVIMNIPYGTFKFTGYTYVSEFVIPNFHFHLSTAYCILRQLGVPLEATDYLRDVFVKIDPPASS